MKYKTLLLITASSLTMLQAQEEQSKDTSKADPFIEGTSREEEEQTRDYPKNISISFESFSMPLQQAAQLLRENLSDEDFYQRILTHLGKNGVQQESLNMIRARSGETATVEHIREYIYPTEYEPGQIPDTVGIAIASPAKEEEPTKIDQEALKTLTNSQPISEIKGLTSPVTPTVFHTRNTGHTLEVQPTIGASANIIDLRFQPGTVLLADLKNWGTDFSKAEMPIFESQRLNTGATIIPNRPCLIGTYNRSPNSTIEPKSADRVWFAFVTARIIVMKP